MQSFINYIDLATDGCIEKDVTVGEKDKDSNVKLDSKSEDCDDYCDSSGIDSCDKIASGGKQLFYK